MPFDGPSRSWNALEEWVEEQLHELADAAEGSDTRGRDDEDFYRAFLERSDDPRALFFLAYEMQFRSQLPAHFRGAVILHLASLVDVDGAADHGMPELEGHQEPEDDDVADHLAQSITRAITAAMGSGTPNPASEGEGSTILGSVDPPSVNPGREVRDSRRRSRSQHEDRGRDWREVGLLSLSGYRVGRTNGLRRAERRQILNWIFMEDDLSDIDDREYARSWGEPRSSKRLKKMADSLAAFVSNRRDAPADFSVAISHWEEDLEYLRTTFFDPSRHRWTWPKAS